MIFQKLKVFKMSKILLFNLIIKEILTSNLIDKMIFTFMKLKNSSINLSKQLNSI